MYVAACVAMGATTLLMLEHAHFARGLDRDLVRYHRDNEPNNNNVSYRRLTWRGPKGRTPIFRLGSGAWLATTSQVPLTMSPLKSLHGSKHVIAYTTNISTLSSPLGHSSRVNVVMMTPPNVILKRPTGLDAEQAKLAKLLI